MNIEELRAELLDVNAAIKSIRNGAQSYNTSSRGVTKVSYESLLKERDRLIADIAALETGCTVLVGWAPRR